MYYNIQQVTIYRVLQRLARKCDSHVVPLQAAEMLVGRLAACGWQMVSGARPCGGAATGRSSWSGRCTPGG